MPGLRLVCAPMLQLRQELRLEQRLELRLGDGEDDHYFETEEEKLQRSQAVLLRKIRDIVDNGDFVDPDHFDCEVTRVMFSKELETKTSDLARDVVSLMHFYSADEKTAKDLLTLIGRDRANERDLPSKIAKAWGKALQSGNTPEESELKEMI